MVCSLLRGFVMFLFPIYCQKWYTIKYTHKLIITVFKKKIFVVVFCFHGDKPVCDWCFSVLPA